MYKYEDEKPKLLTDKGAREFIRRRDKILKLLRDAGAFRSGEAMSLMAPGDTWEMLATLDRMKEIGDLVELTNPDEVAGQHRVFVAL